MRTTGISIEHNANGLPSFARIDLKRYGAELNDFFISKGVILQEAPYDPEFVAKIEESEKQIKNGQFKIIKTEDLWK